MPKRIRQAVCCVLLLIVLATTGCWDRTEINDLAFVMGSALDLTEDGKVLGTFQIALPNAVGIGPSGEQAGGGQQRSVFIVSATGRNVHDLERKVQEKLSRRLYKGHRRVIFIGERLAKRGIGDLLDQFSRDPTSRLRTQILVAKGRQGQEMLQVQYPFERIPSEAVRELERTGVGVEVTIRDFLIMASGEGIQPVMAAMESVSVPDIKGPAGNGGQAGEGQLEERGRQERQTIRLWGMAIFKDFKLAGYLNDEETRGWMWVTGKLQRGVITAYVPEGGGNVSVDLTKAEREIKPEINGNRVKIRLRVEGEGVIHENDTNLDLSEPQNVKIAEKALKKSIEQRVRRAIAKAQQDYQADIFGFGEQVQRTHPKTWKSLKEQWKQRFPETEVEILADFSVIRTGMSGAPLHLQEKEVKKQ
ncbi:Ger(x)C family spore germination protein [Effusibacillus pohliae]|uniref:Ger(x)C family spore germination protein n=1 Tax=Effusibacillus pohliae TaxID=232270 RepID=UPI00036537FF|nr:Ger(x)C family spore germination protein [Effusibacillus pohliae]